MQVPLQQYQLTMSRTERLSSSTNNVRMPLGKEVGLSFGDIVLDGDPAPLPWRGTTFPLP